jgi:hypothetical protein
VTREEGQGGVNFLQIHTNVAEDAAGVHSKQFTDVRAGVVEDDRVTGRAKRVGSVRLDLLGLG